MLTLSNIDTEILAELEAAEEDDAAANDQIASAFMHRIQAGWRLLEKKETIPHDGKWREYIGGLANELAAKGYPRSGKPYSLRWFQEWMYLAKHLATEEEARPVAHLGMKENLRRIRQENKPPKPDPLLKDVAGEDLTILVGDCRERIKEIPDQSAHCCICSPPYYFQRVYEGLGADEQIGLEADPDTYITHLVEVFNEVWRVLRDDGTLWIVIGDSYNSSPSGANPGGFQGAAMRAHPEYNAAHPRMRIKGRYENGLKPKDLIGIPFRLAFALQEKGWCWRSDIIWHKTTSIPESCRDRPTNCHEHILLLTKTPNYYFDKVAVQEPCKSPPTLRDKHSEGYDPGFPKGDRFSPGARIFGADGKRACRNIWEVAIEPYAGDHYASFPKALVKPMVLAGCPIGGTILDCFAGTGTTGLVANALGRKAVLIEASPKYAAMAKARIKKELGDYTAKANSEDAWGNPVIQEVAEAAE
jgi:DNA modification methylase